jgi:8-oxo-dGTP pyrophosphatase MutT (NUDIX family)
MKPIAFESLEDLLRRPKPGLAAQLEMAPIPRPGTVAYPDTPPDCRQAAVLILLYPKENETHIVFIRRPRTSLHHKDQIAFPGGRIEGRESPIEAALREAREEVGVLPRLVRIAGELTPLYVPPSNFCVTPAVGTASARPAFVPFPEEVDEILEVPLARLLAPDAVIRETWPLERGNALVPFYAFEGHKIWGATAMILAEFLTLLRLL